MDLKNLTDKAKELIDKRGGTDSLKEDAGELKDIASSKGSFVDKAKDAVEAIKDPGDDSVASPAPPPTDAPAAEATPAEPERTGRVRRDEGSKQGRGGHGRGGRGRGRRGGGRGGRDGDPAV